MRTIGTPGSDTATRVMLLGSGELGKEVAIELQRLGCEVIAVDRYERAPAMQVAHRCHVIDMGDGSQRAASSPHNRRRRRGDDGRSEIDDEAACPDPAGGDDVAALHAH